MRFLSWTTFFLQTYMVMSACYHWGYIFFMTDRYPSNLIRINCPNLKFHSLHGQTKFQQTTCDIRKSLPISFALCVINDRVDLLTTT